MGIRGTTAHRDAEDARTLTSTMIGATGVIGDELRWPLSNPLVFEGVQAIGCGHATTVVGPVHTDRTPMAVEVS